MDYNYALQELPPTRSLPKNVWANWLRKYGHVREKLLQESNGIPYLIYNLGNPNEVVEFYRVYIALKNLEVIFLHDLSVKKQWRNT